MVSGGTHEEALLVSSEDLDNISILLDQDNNLEEESTHLFNEVSIFIFKFQKKPPQNKHNSLRSHDRQKGSTYQVNIV